MSGIVNLPMGGGTDFTDGYIFKEWHLEDASGFWQTFNGSGVLCLLYCGGDGDVTIKTEKNTVVFRRYYDSLSISMFPNYMTAHASYGSSLSPILNQVFPSDGQEFNYKENPTVINNFENSYYYCNPPIAFNEFLTISTPTFSRNGYTYCLVLYKPK